MITAGGIKRIQPHHVYDMRTLRRALQRMIDIKQQEICDLLAQKDKLERELLFERGYVQALLDQESGALADEPERNCKEK